MNRLLLTTALSTALLFGAVTGAGARDKSGSDIKGCLNYTLTPAGRVIQDCRERSHPSRAWQNVGDGADSGSGSGGSGSGAGGGGSGSGGGGNGGDSGSGGSGNGGNGNGNGGGNGSNGGGNR